METRAILLQCHPHLAPPHALARLQERRWECHLRRLPSSSHDSASPESQRPVNLEADRVDERQIAPRRPAPRHSCAALCWPSFASNVMRVLAWPLRMGTALFRLLPIARALRMLAVGTMDPTASAFGTKGPKSAQPPNVHRG